jgi:hypothetical protein
MPRPGFEMLRSTLIRGGVAPRYVARTVLELREHYADLEEDALAAGLSPWEAAAEARERLGAEESLASAVLAHRELLTWRRRQRWIGAALVPLGELVSASPSAAGESMILRWSVSAGLGAVLTGALLLTMQTVIMFA